MQKGWPLRTVLGGGVPNKTSPTASNLTACILPRNDLLAATTILNGAAEQPKKKRGGNHRLGRPRHSDASDKSELPANQRCHCAGKSPNKTLSKGRRSLKRALNMSEFIHEKTGVILLLQNPTFRWHCKRLECTSGIVEHLKIRCSRSKFPEGPNRIGKM